MKKIFYKNHLVKKHLGQFFLIKKNIIESIVQNINPKEDQVLIEIGPGLGALTYPILSIVKTMNVIEIDKNLALRLKKNLSNKNNLNIFQRSVINFNFTKFRLKNRKSLRIFGNLPYNISTLILISIIDHIDSVNDMYFTLQKEVADRLLANPGNKKYGRLTIIMQYYFHIQKILEISPDSFIPIPKVYSTLVSLKPKKSANKNIGSIIEKITNTSFEKRRKKIKNSLSKLFSINSFKKLEINNQLRAENLSVKEYSQLAHYLFIKEKKHYSNFK